MAKIYLAVWLGMWYKKYNVFDDSQTSEKDEGKFYKTQNLKSWEWRELEIINKKAINTLEIQRFITCSPLLCFFKRCKVMENNYNIMLLGF